MIKAEVCSINLQTGALISVAHLVVLATSLLNATVSWYSSNIRLFCVNRGIE